MFTHHCSACDRTQLISLTQATSLERLADGGLGVEFTCWCGSLQRHELLPLGRGGVSQAV